MIRLNPSDSPCNSHTPTASKKLEIDVANLQTQIHDAITIDPATGGLLLNNQKLTLKIDPSSNNLLVAGNDGLLVDLNTVIALVQPASSRGNISRLTITADITLTASDTTRQHLLNQSGADRNVLLPASPVVSQEFEVINNSTSTFNLIFAGETIIPGARHIVQWDGVEWLAM
ncbi:MAG: hypothetical protein RLZZ171_2989 [Cyanobacteriota bacterium]|jgi:hypothetical protein